MSHFLYKLTPPRPSFLEDMTPAEATAMEAHFAYWADLIDQGSVIAYGPVLDPTGTYGIAIVEADDQEHVNHLGQSDPAVIGGAGTFAVFPMPSTVVRA
jgi:uncharacterized protein YciI